MWEQMYQFHFMWNIIFVNLFLLNSADRVIERQLSTLYRNYVNLRGITRCLDIDLHYRTVLSYRLYVDLIPVAHIATWRQVSVEFTHH